MARNRRRRKPSVIFSALVSLAGVVGVLALPMGVLAYRDGARQRARHDLVAALPDLTTARPGEVGVLEGRVAADMPALRDGFVAYLVEEYRGKGWRTTGGQVQPLTVETPSGAVQVVNADYAFDRAVDGWTTAEREVSPPGMTTGAVRLQGLVPGGSLMVVGRAEPGGPPRQVVAQTVAGVDRRTYLERLTRRRDAGRSILVVLLLVAPVGIAFALWGGRRVLRG